MTKITVDKALIDQALDHLINLQPKLANGLINKRQLEFIDPYVDEAIKALRAALAAPAVEPVKKGLFVDLIAQHPGLAEELAAIVIDAPAEPVASTQWKGLTDVQLMNIVNKNDAWYGFSVWDAMHEVVKLTEARLEMNNKPAPAAEVPLLTLKEIIDIDEEVMKAPRNYCVKFARAIEKLVRQKVGIK